MLKAFVLMALSLTTQNLSVWLSRFVNLVCYRLVHTLEHVPIICSCLFVLFIIDYHFLPLYSSPSFGGPIESPLLNQRLAAKHLQVRQTRESMSTLCFCLQANYQALLLMLFLSLSLSLPPSLSFY